LAGPYPCAGCSRSTPGDALDPKAVATACPVTTTATKRTLEEDQNVAEAAQMETRINKIIIGTVLATVAAAGVIAVAVIAIVVVRKRRYTRLEEPVDPAVPLEPVTVSAPEASAQ
jgi:heme/copper-type cytochrome/quinol oxidase subunit 2